MPPAESAKISRRSILAEGVSAAALLGLATTGIYTVGSFLKGVDGGLTAGAKTWNMTLSGGSGTYGCTGNSSCPSSIGSCTTAGATVTITKCGCDGTEWMSASYKCE